MITRLGLAAPTLDRCDPISHVFAKQQTAVPIQLFIQNLRPSLWLQSVVEDPTKASGSDCCPTQRALCFAVARIVNTIPTEDVTTLSDSGNNARLETERTHWLLSI